MTSPSLLSVPYPYTGAGRAGIRGAPCTGAGKGGTILGTLYAGTGKGGTILGTGCCKGASYPSGKTVSGMTIEKGSSAAAGCLICLPVELEAIA